MGVEKKFVKNGFDKTQMAEYFSKQLERAGYGGMNINRTPMGTQVTIFAEKPGMIIGKGGRTIHKLTHDLETVFRVDNPQIDVQEVKIPELNAQMMASRLAGAIERGLYFRKAGHNMLRRIMESGALGCEIDIAGKLTGPRKRTEKFVAGNMLHAGNPAMELVDKGFAIAIKKLGVIGCRVRLIRPSVKLPGRFKTTEIAVPQEAAAAGKKPEGIKELVKAAPVPAEKKPEIKPEITRPAPETAKETVPEEIHTGNIEERMHGDVLEHKHAQYDYWHPASRTHKMEE
ncbi:MAG: 30S ribosomal protein S3 [Candidatus Methanoperedens sp.]|uniref:30S ribosomal protein S3 n=1 Tax=Candidatus Methanoperedens sp. BLZ2 TaxID=2035255 RepID=UPI000BE37D14|nr:30S ribosomal protein S3 [Candidatus Methanoperedens sp. BLZ2]KAB2945666.1 MAG: 30S ribosomal protein S3 [Candidatus Methanoperedens sp.]MBZ0177293.1 30S ribosomal protein S3 [Candidatus Methanoperedens nitroreducens]MCX9076829.1 30S ribosomal protein S3 [Candidatus Methanoperedens sp.]